jgi:cytochrome c-type biogenesis protein CcmH
MILFAILGALLIFLALYFIVPPLLKQPTLTSAQKAQKHIGGVRSELKKYKSDLDAGTLNQQAYNSARQKLATQVIEEIESPGKIKINTPPLRGRWAGWIVGLSIPVLAIGMYSQLGKPELINSTPGSTAQTPGNHGGGEVGSIEDMIAALKEKLKNQPDDAEGWYMLARSYMSQKEYPDAVEAMKKVVALESDNANILMQYADALAMTNNGRVSGEAEKVIHQALAIEPKHPEALWLAGIAAEEQGQHEKAIGHWGKALGEMQDDPESKRLLEEAIADARSKMSGGSATVSDNTDAEEAAAAPQQEAKAQASSITVDVSLTPELKEQAKPEDTVFIFARATEGPPMPLAAQRRQVKDLPFTVTLDDSQAMMPDRKLSNFDQVIVGARVSSSGNPTKQSGDLEGLSEPISPSQGTTTSIVIDKVTAL